MNVEYCLPGKSVMGHGRRFSDVCDTSALPPRATFELTLLNVSKVAEPKFPIALFDRFVGDGQDRPAS